MMDTQSIVAITGCVIGVVTAISAVANNYMTYRLKLQATANGEKTDHLHECLETGHAEIMAKVQENTDITVAGQEGPLK